MNRTWNSESKRYAERMYRKYEMSLEEAFDKQAFEADPVGYFKSIDYKITGFDWIPAMWNLIKMAWSDYTPSKYESMGPKFGPKGQKAIAIMKQVINNNPKLKSRVERLQARAPKNEKQVETEISELMGELKESSRSSYNRLEEGLGGKAKLGIIISLLALLTMSTVGAKSSYSKNEDWISNNINPINKNSYSSYIQKDSNITGVRAIADLVLESISKTGTSENKFIYFLQDSGLIGKMDISKNDIGSRKDYEDTRDALAEDILNNIYANYRGNVDSTVSRVQKVANKYFSSLESENTKTIKTVTKASANTGVSATGTEIQSQLTQVRNLVTLAANVKYGYTTSDSMSQQKADGIIKIVNSLGGSISKGSGDRRSSVNAVINNLTARVGAEAVVEAFQAYLS
jgi:hypothetical protein